MYDARRSMIKLSSSLSYSGLPGLHVRTVSSRTEAPSDTGLLFRHSQSQSVSRVPETAEFGSPLLPTRPNPTPGLSGRR